MQCAKCGLTMEYTPLLNEFNYHMGKLFNCWHCLFSLGKIPIMNAKAKILKATAETSFWEFIGEHSKT